MRKIRKMTSVAVAVAAITTLSLATAGAAHAEVSKPFRLNHAIRTGNCTMFEGARWTLTVEVVGGKKVGVAKFDGTVTSSHNNDAWLMWAFLKDANGAVLGAVTNDLIQDPTDRAKFVMNLPDRRRPYRYFHSGKFDASKFNLIKKMELGKYC
ncbi:DUF6294 family protein [Sphaerisporangium sp. NPDC051011]|uniref:DUF6294 family protein n=1 Tax=Sphaerisporangium sp. NPDC051011 TaxID=3155792 RepID=UPI0033F1B153